MTETRGAQPSADALGLFPLLSRVTPEGREVFAMQTKRTVDGTPTPPAPDSTLITLPAVAQRSARRATARRASDAGAAAPERKDDVEGRIVEYLKDRPTSTTGAIATREAAR
jgi:hypothetical protein